MTNIQIPDGDGVWTMTDAEFKRELANAWDEGMEAMYESTSHEWPPIPEANPYRSQA